MFVGRVVVAEEVASSNARVSGNGENELAVP